MPLNTPLNTLIAGVMNALPKGAKVFVACSGGRDSLALAYACVLAHQDGMIDTLPTLIHINHNLQAPSGAWADFVKSFASRHGFECVIKSVVVNGTDENSARQARYQAFFEVMNDGDVLMLAHHANDQAETMLMRLVNGAGLQGVSGIKPIQQKRASQKTITLIRPLLGVTRDELTAFCHAHHLDYIDDPTNDTANNVRGQLRQAVIPALTAINPKAVQNFAKTAEHLYAINEFVADTVGQYLAMAVYSPHDFVDVLDLAKLYGTHHAIMPLVVQKFIQKNAPLPPTSRLVDDVLSLISRSDNDHHSELLWQAGQGTKEKQKIQQEQAWILVRYDDKLYRYRYDFWRALDGEFVIEDGYFVSQINPAIRLIVPACAGALQKMTNTTKIKVNRHTYAGKKLYQRLRIMPWLRRQLWLGDGKIVSLGESWALDLAD